MHIVGYLPKAPALLVDLFFRIRNDTRRGRNGNLGDLETLLGRRIVVHFFFDIGVAFLQDRWCDRDTAISADCATHARGENAMMNVTRSF
jgi:hypothetical protein